MWQPGMPQPAMGQSDTEHTAVIAQTKAPLGIGPHGVMAQGTPTPIQPTPEPPVVVVPSKPAKENTTEKKDKAKTDLAPPGVDFFSPPTIGPPPKIPTAKPETEDFKPPDNAEKSKNEGADKISAWPPTSQAGKVPLKKYPSVKKEAPLIVKSLPDKIDKAEAKQSAVPGPPEEPEKSPAITIKLK
jgi:hypothetical protein